MKQRPEADLVGEYAMDAIKNCSECGEPIPPERLSAAPNTSLCVACKGKREKQPHVTAHEKPEYRSAQKDRKAEAQVQKNIKAILSDPEWQVRPK
jgi:hypothetical protein